MGSDRGKAKSAGSTKPQRRRRRKGGSGAAQDGFDEAFDREFERERAELERSGRTLTRVLFFVFLAIALLMAVVAVWTGINTSRKLARERSSLGQVTALTERKDAEGSIFYYPVVAFDVPDGGQYDVQLAEGSWPPAHRVGDLVTVLYDPANPLEARIASRGGTFALWTWTLVAGVLAVGFGGATVLAFALGRD